MIRKIKLDKKLENYSHIEDVNVFLDLLLSRIN